MSFQNQNGVDGAAAPAFKLNYELVKNWPFQSITETYSREDVIRYALGIGVGQTEGVSEEERKYLIDNDTLTALPMMAIILNQGPMWTADPATGIDWTKTIHIEEILILHKPLPAQATVIANYSVDEIYDKGASKGAMMYESRHLSCKTGEPLATIKIGTYLRGNGGFGGSDRGAPVAEPVPVERAPDTSIELRTPDRSIDTFHLGKQFLGAVKADPRVGDKPMLRGVCSFGIAGRAVLKLVCDNNPERMKMLGLRYKAPVFAEETLRTEVWFGAPGKAHFRVWCVERNEIVIDNGFVEFVA